ncbi:MAG: sulfite exporter TauE/SafE family protein [Planctomycetota bacterium]|nr:sulfite exporter TauE/SafE family protein [Planctomycetota bacterium]
MAMLWIAFIGGASAFAHCVGMCGPFALHLSRGPTRPAVLANQLLWHAGRITTYVFLGALAGGLGKAILRVLSVSWAPKALAFSAGGVMILTGLALLGLRPRFRAARGEQPAGGGLIAGLFGPLMGPPRPAGALALGLATGFLPCPIVLAGLAMAVQTGSVPGGMALMAAMGAGTLWSVLLLGLAGQAVTAGLRRWGAPLAGAIILLMGVVTVLRGTEAFHHLLGCPTPAKTAPAPCCCGQPESAPVVRGNDHD